MVILPLHLIFLLPFQNADVAATKANKSVTQSMPTNLALVTITQIVLLVCLML